MYEGGREWGREGMCEGGGWEGEGEKIIFLGVDSS